MPPPTRDKVFISYSHHDATWLERVLIFLKPFLQEGSLSIWNDKYIEVGSLWWREIDSGLQQAAVGLLLVSPHFLASDFIMGEELPALLDAAERNLLKLVWVPVSASNWEHSPLRHYQAGWDPSRPLDDLKLPARNRALVQITQKIDEAAKTYAAAVPTQSAIPRRMERTVPAIKSAGETLTLVDPYNVPNLPPHYVPRADDLERLRRSLLEHDSATVGITGEPYRMGLHGQGGIGKSVLAAALARDEHVRRAFPEGVFWVTVGQAPDVPRLQATLLAAAKAESTAATDEQRGRQLLEDRFAHSAVLLVLDDVWDYRHARAFDVLGPASRLLVTTRDGAVLTALGAHPETIQRLPEAAALALLSSWAGRDVDFLPEAAYEVASECGYLPLALSLAGALVQDGTPWEVLLKALKQGRLEFLDHPYGSVFRSMRLSVDALSPDVRQRYLELAVFPEDERVPGPVVLALWKETAGLDELDGEALLARLDSKALLDVLDKDGRREVALHDLQHDFLRLSVLDLPALHGKLLAGLAAKLPAAGQAPSWWRLTPDLAYTWSHLAGHLVAAGRGEELRGLLFDCRWLEAKLRASGLPAVLADFTVLSPDEDLSLVTGALRLSGHVLGRAPGQLRSQLTGRLLSIARPRIRGLVDGAAAAAPGPWLRPRTPSLAPPTGSLLCTLTGHVGGVEAVAVTADGRRAVSGSHDRTVKVWDLETGAHERTLTGHRGWIGAVAVTADGQRAVSGSGDGTVKVWNLDTGAEEHTLAGHTGGVVSVAVTVDGRRAVSGSSDRTVKVWNLETGVEERTLTGHADRVEAVAVTADGRRAVSGSYDGTVKVWNLETGAAERTLVGHAGRVSAVAVTTDGRRAVSGADDRMVKVWDLATGAVERTLAGHAGEVRAVAVSPDGCRAVSGSSDQAVKAWDLETGAEERTLPDHAGGVTAVALSSDGRRAVSGSSDRTVKAWDLEIDGEASTPANHALPVTAVAVTSDGRHAVSGSHDRMVKVWDVETGVEQRTLSGHQGPVMAVAVTADGRRAVSGSTDRSVKVWNLETGAEGQKLEGHADRVRAVAVTADGRRAISSSDDRTLKVWNLETGAAQRRSVFRWDRADDRTLKARNLETGAEKGGAADDWGRAVAMTADGRRAVSGSYNLKVWNLETNVEERTLKDARWVRAVAVTADGRRAVSSSDDRTLKVWNLATGAEGRTLSSYEDGVTTVGVTADGRRAVSGSYDGTVKVWDLESGRIVATFTADAPIGCCAVAPDGVRVLAGDHLGRVHFLLLEGMPPE